MIVRVALVLAALAAAAWVGASLRAVQLEARAGGIIRASGAGPDRTERLSTVADLLERARKWAPYQAPVLTEAFLLARVGKRRRAVTLLEDMVRREPHNPEAWAMLARVSMPVDPARSRAARRRARELNPPIARR